LTRHRPSHMPEAKLQRLIKSKLKLSNRKPKSAPDYRILRNWPNRA
jgi:hypothetical protein